MYYVSPSFHSHFFFIRIKQIYLFSVFFQARSTATIFANERDVFPLLAATSICCAAVLWLSIARSATNSLISSTPFLICLARNCNRTATAAVAALVQKRKIVGQTLKKRSWWSCLEKMKISCDTKPSAPLNGCQLLASFTRGARNKT